MFGYVDGSVHFISELVESQPNSRHDDLVFENLMARNDGNVNVQYSQ